MSRKLRGKVEHRDLEGGIWELVAADGSRTTLLGEAKALRGLQGAQVEVEGEDDEGFGFAMAGPQLRVAKVRKL